MLPPRARAYYWFFGAACTGILVLVAYQRRSELADLVPLGAWILLLAVVQLLPIRGWLSASLSFDYPIATAAALVLSPIQVGVVGFIAAFDTKEFRREITLAKTLFNRSQAAAAYALASLAVHAIIRAPSFSVLILPVALLALLIILFANYLFIGLALSFEYGYRVGAVISRLQVGALTDFLLSLASSAVLGAMLAVLYDRVHLWALGAFLCPTLLARQILQRSRESVERDQAYRAREAVLIQLSQTIHQERDDERRLIAADLHDEVLQPLFRVSLLAQVLRMDLVSGRLLEMDEDVPELLSAAELASAKLRALIGDLRESAIGAGGLSRTLVSLINALARESDMAFHKQIELVAIPSDTQLGLYQIAKEALANAKTHAHGQNVWATLLQDTEGVTLVVRDDGVGFDPLDAKPQHFGLDIMRERAAALGGTLYVDTFPRKGTTVTAFVPTSNPAPPPRPARKL